MKRFWILTVVLALLPLSGCKKSEGTKIENFFGAPPTVSEVTLTKERRTASCLKLRDLCTCCCFYMVYDEAEASIDLVTASAKVVDTTPPEGSSLTDILVVVLRFLEPPPAEVAAGTQISQFSLEMFDTGPVAVGSMYLSSLATYVDIYTGDQDADDGTFTRKFYFGTSTPTQAGTCIEEKDKEDFLHTYSTYSTSLTVAPSATVEYQFTVQAIDRSGNIATSTEYPLPIQGTFRETVYGVQLPCGPYVNGVNDLLGCYPTYP